MSRLGVGNKFWVYERPRLTSEDRWKSKFVLKGIFHHDFRYIIYCNYDLKAFLNKPYVDEYTKA